MAWLDCTDLATTEVSFESAGIDIAQLNRAITDFDEASFDDLSVDSEEWMPQEILAALKLDVHRIQFEGVFYFHGTRAIDTEGISRYGLLPLDQVIESVWETLAKLAAGTCGGAEWTEFRHSVEHSHPYSMKMSKPSCYGPFGVLVRQTLVQYEEAEICDFIECPEIVRDICQQFHARHDVDLEARFAGVSQSTIVKFRSPHASCDYDVRAALWYLFGFRRGSGPHPWANTCFDGAARPVPPEDIVKIEVLAG